jgi:hypothetical protein
MGVSGSMGSLDYVRIPAMAVFAGLTFCAVACCARRANAPL